VEVGGFTRKGEDSMAVSGVGYRKPLVICSTG